ncbi:hypothetical protein [Nocardia mexicana]|uniref:Uncharacterized protein n=1 Tax=Nocardia mexicana TaxID=279262 RepID=A0A370GFQ8_9NOCA|nr:hypothetical protein [Nocardia mexicana]RDI42517.1 hypothetical protein DFR68_12655 [Nocardia mexicana]
MEWRTRIFEFPGGMLEVQAYEGESVDDGPGIYLELYGRDIEADSEYDDSTDWEAS